MRAVDLGCGLGEEVDTLGHIEREERVEVNPKLIGPESHSLFQAILALSTIEECYAFFEDILTTAELHSVAQRWQVASLLDRGQTYEDVARATGASSATISRVNRCLRFGADGYRLVLDRLNSQEPG